MIESGLKFLIQWLIEFAPLMTILAEKKLTESLSKEKNQGLKTIESLIEGCENLIANKSDESSFKEVKELQHQLSIYHRETQLKLAAYQRETALKLPEINKVLDNWPLKLYPSQLLESHPGSGPIPLKIFLAPPQVSFDRWSNTVKQETEIDLKFVEGLREFINTHYSLHSPLRPTEVLAGAWESKRFHSESSIKALFGMLKSEPTLILESEIEGNYLNFRIAYWGLGQENYYYKTIAKFSYQAMLHEAAKARALKWKETREQLLELGENSEEIKQLGGDNEINLALLEKEEKWQAKGIDVSQFSLNYQIGSKDREKLGQFLSDCHCLVVGWVADIYHLVYRDIPPLLPALLPSLTGEVVDLQLVQAIVSGYQQVYQSLEKERRYWVPELALQLARSLTHLPEKSWAREQINYSLQSWLNLRHIQLPTDGNLLEGMKPALTLSDRDYLEKLKDCFTALEDDKETAQVQGLLEELAQTYPPLSLAATPREEGNGSPHPLRIGPYAPLYTLKEHSGKISSVAISPDGQTLVSGCLDKTIKIWNLHNGELLRTLTGHSEDISSLAISPDGQFLASSSFHCPKSNVKVWNLKTGKLLHNGLGHKKSVRFVAIDSEARILVSGSNKIKIWNLHTGDRLCTLWHCCPVNAAIIIPDGSLLVSGSSDGKIKLWNPRTGDPLGTLTGHTGAVTSLVIDADGQFLMSGSVDKTIKIWQLETGKLQSTLKGHSARINSLSISPDRRVLISGSADKTIKIWHLLCGELQHTLTGHSGGVNSVAMSADGRTFVSGSSDKTMKIWRVL